MIDEGGGGLRRRRLCGRGPSSTSVAETAHAPGGEPAHAAQVRVTIRPIDAFFGHMTWGRGTRGGTALALGVAGVLALAPAASAATFTVDTAGDLPDLNSTDNACDIDPLSAGNQCTLRGAIQEANRVPGADVINFAKEDLEPPEPGDQANTKQVVLTGPLETITQQVTINGCSATPGSDKPCIAITSSPTAVDALILGNAPNSTISGLAFIGLSRGVVLNSGANNVTLRNNSFGLSLNQRRAGSDEEIANAAIETAANEATIEGNTIGNAENAVLIRGGDNNLIQGNFIGTRADGKVKLPTNASAIRITDATGNVIGGNTGAAENVISNSKGDAIEIVGELSEANEIRRNRGSDNAGLFIDLDPPNGPGNSFAAGPHGGILPPTITGATMGGAAGTGEPGATVRVFRKSSESRGELGAFLGSATADGSGAWALSYGSEVPAGTLITATQTTAFGTSELVLPAVATTEPAPPPPPPPPPPTEDTDPPETTIVKGPPEETTKTKAKFSFAADESGSTFECKLDKRRFTPCESPKRYKHLKPGDHVFKVKATDPSGNTDPSPAKQRFEVKKPKKRKR